MFKLKARLIQVREAVKDVLRNADNFATLHAEIYRLSSENKLQTFRIEKLLAELRDSSASVVQFRREAFAAEKTLTAIKNYLRGQDDPFIQKRLVLAFFAERTL